MIGWKSDWVRWLSGSFRSCVLLCRTRPILSFLFLSLCSSKKKEDIFLIKIYFRIELLFVPVCPNSVSTRCSWTDLVLLSTSLCGSAAHFKMSKIKEQFIDPYRLIRLLEMGSYVVLVRLERVLIDALEQVRLLWVCKVTRVFLAFITTFACLSRTSFGRTNRVLAQLFYQFVFLNL